MSKEECSKCDELTSTIKENDGLPHVVCLRCIGALEFLCDFYSCCQLTQDKLSVSEEASKYSLENTLRRIPQQENDAESNKENVLPSSNETKRRGKVASPSKKDQPTNENTLDDRKQSAANNAIVEEQKLQDEQSNDNALARGNPLSIKDISKKGSKFLNSCTVSMKKGESNDKIALTEPKRPVRDRKPTVSLNRIKESQISSDETERDWNQRKRQCLGTICTNSTSNVSDETEREMNPRKRQSLGTICTNGTSNVTKNAAILSTPQIELPLENKVATIATIPSRKRYIKNDNANKDLIDGVAEVTLKDESLNEENKEKGSTTSKVISVIVKQEKADVEVISQEIGKPNQLVWIPNEMLTEGRTIDPTIDQDQEIDLDLSLRLSPELDDETENSDVVATARTDSNDSNDSNDSVDSDDSEDSEDSEDSDDPEDSDYTDDPDYTDDTEQPKTKLPSVEQTRATVIRSSRESPVPVVVKLDGTNNIDGTKNDSKFDLQFSRGKISELISEEQKEEIETYYRIDMSAVNAEEVQKNLTVIDKKKIRCNICGSLYLRMDKCQVHIWGHLQMKPFQCKACDFATVTVSNVRCHIRKSHLKIKPYACKLCGKSYATNGLLMQHINGHTGSRPYKCEICDFQCATRQMLSYHSSVNHKPLKVIKCKICAIEFYSRSKLRTHMLVHKKGKVVMCKLCSAYLSNAKALETHHKNLHMQDYVCDICGKHMKSKKALHNHQNVHSTGKYKCTLCPNVYKSSQILKEHLLKHEGIRKYRCSDCGKTFGQQSHLAAHKAVHSEVRFYCPGCEKSFNRHDNMKIHTKRCKPFLANPELKKLLIKKERTSSTSKANKSTEDTISKDSSSLNLESFFEKQTDNEEISIKTVNDKEETAMKLGLNISCIDSPDKSWISDNVYQEVGELTGSAEVSAIQIAEPNDTFILENDNVRILEIL